MDAGKIAPVLFILMAGMLAAGSAYAFKRSNGCGDLAGQYGVVGTIYHTMFLEKCESLRNECLQLENDFYNDCSIHGATETLINDRYNYAKQALDKAAAEAAAASAENWFATTTGIQDSNTTAQALCEKLIVDRNTQASNCQNRANACWTLKRTIDTIELTCNNFKLHRSHDDMAAKEGVEVCHGLAYRVVPIQQTLASETSTCQGSQITRGTASGLEGI